MNKNGRFIVTFLSTFAVISIIWAEKLPSAAVLSQRIDKEGARKVIEEIWANPETFRNLQVNISRGSEEWLRIADKFAEHSDAGITTGLYQSMWWALANSPQNIFRIVENVSYKEYCSAQEFEQENAVVLRKLELARKAVERVTASKFQKKRDACLDILNQQIQSLRGK